MTKEIQNLSLAQDNMTNPRATLKWDSGEQLLDNCDIKKKNPTSNSLFTKINKPQIFHESKTIKFSIKM